MVTENIRKGIRSVAKSEENNRKPENEKERMGHCFEAHAATYIGLNLINRNTGYIG